MHVQVHFGPGDVGDWHDHPGFVLIAVRSGTLTFYDPDCTAHRLCPGEAFVEAGGPTKAVNEGPRSRYARYVVPEGSPRIVPPTRRAAHARHRKGGAAGCGGRVSRPEAA